MPNYNTEQESFWAGEFGSSYISRNMDGKQAIANRVCFWRNILQETTRPASSVLELGANVGINLDALNILLPKSRLSAVEINADAVNVLRTKKHIDVFHGSILDFTPERQWEFVFTSGVLIHLNPDVLPSVYALMAKSSSRYVCIAEYYSPSPVEITYRGHSGKLFKRDFAGEFMRAFPEFYLRKYGFAYHGDPLFPADDINWFLLERKQPI